MRKFTGLLPADKELCILIKKNYRFYAKQAVELWGEISK